MALDWNNDYSAAGPGAKRRRVERMTLDTIPRKIARDRPKPEYRRNRKPQGDAEEEPIKLTVKGIKHRITLLTLQHENFLDICDRLRNEGFGDLTKVLIGSHRETVKQVLRIMIDENLIAQDDLNQYRKQARAAYRKRFKRGDERD